ncbi:MAG: hydrolase 1, exosortase A system-associated [Azoarcus sp.]|jgi:exosortase A-associated hydrolase 1|nr:hydrolase 1, exosortase A system-associated [Azoarcus sp.]
MMEYDERAFFFACDGESLPGIVACPRAAPEAERETERETCIGVLIVVGGPQYRVGSHRQFVLLARTLAAEGIACMRFDYRGMGDASGEPRAFDAVEHDICAAIDAFFSEVPTLSGVMLWGLCDGASAAALYAGDDPRVVGLLLLNPWVHGEANEACVFLRYYYPQRLRSRAFWAKLLRGGIRPLHSLRGYWRTLRRARGAVQSVHRQALPERMLLALRMLALPWWVILSGKDYVAREFEQAAASPAWAELYPARIPYHVPDADHTFSSAASRRKVEEKTLQCVRALTRIVRLLDSV